MSSLEAFEVAEFGNWVFEFQAKFGENGTNVSQFAEEVEKRRNLVAQQSSTTPGSFDKKISGRVISERTVRYYQTKGWIAAPLRGDGKRVLYTALHYAQMLTAYRLRLEGKAPVELAKVRLAASIKDCLALLEPEEDDALTREADRDPEDAISEGSEEVPQEPCRRVTIQFWTLEGDRLAGALADDLCEWLKRLLGDSSCLRLELGEVIERPSDNKSIREMIPTYRERNAVPANVCVQVITSDQHPLSWFADWAETNALNGVVHLDNYENELGVSRAALALSYSMLLALSGELFVRGVSPYELFHMKSPLGCLFDFCQERSDVALKLGSGGICKTCLDRIRPHVADDLLVDIAGVLDGIRRKVSAIGRALPDVESELDRVLRNVLVHAVVECGSESEILPEDDESMYRWVFESEVGTKLGVESDLKALEKSLQSLDAKTEAMHYLENVERKLEALHPNLEFGQVGGIGSHESTCAIWKELGSATRYADVSSHVCKVDHDGATRVVLRLPGGAVVDVRDGLPLRGCEAFEERAKSDH